MRGGEIDKIRILSWGGVSEEREKDNERMGVLKGWGGGDIKKWGY